MKFSSNSKKNIADTFDIPWIFKLCTLSRRAMLYARQEPELIDKITEIIKNETPYPLARFDLIPKTGSTSPIFLKNAENVRIMPQREKFPIKKSLIIKDIKKSAHLPSCSELLQEGLNSALLLSLTSPSEKEPPKFLGTLGIYVPTDYIFDSREVKLLEDLAEDLGEAIMKIRQVSESKGETLELTWQNKIYHSVFENTGTGTIIIDRDMLILFANEKFAALVGYKREELETRIKWSQFVIPEDNPKMQRYHYGRRQGLPDIPDEYECRIFNKAGEVKYMYMKVGVIPETGISIASFMDISSRKFAEERLRESESQLRTIISAFDGIIYTTSRDYEIGFMNSTLIKRIGRNAVGEKCFKAVHGLDSPCSWCNIKAALMGETFKNEEKSPKDNRWYSSIQSPVYDDCGRISKIETILIDITQRKQEEEKIVEHANYLRKENIVLRSAMKERYKFGNIVGKSRVMQNVYELIIRAASSSAHVILYGESGTGKELVARAIHNLSNRSNNNFVPVNCGAISENIIESEFFGYKKGAFTGADTDKQGFLDAANDGTLFLDEIGDIGLNIQVKLLRAIEGGGYTPVGGNQLKKPNLRIVAATNKNLKSLVNKGQMREDFFYRIHIIPIKIPPLRERKEDLPLLIDHFLSAYGNEMQLPPMGSKTMEAFYNYDWPGNVRELQNTLHRYITLRKIDFIENLSETATPRQEDLMEIQEAGSPGDNLTTTIANIEKRLIVKALEENRWLKAKTASDLGIHRKTLFTKMKKYGLT